MVRTKQQKAPIQVIRAVGYCRTSGEGQRDNTSIPRQRDAIEHFCKLNGWKFLRHYIDESKTGSKEEGRNEFQEMLRAAANDQFNMVVVFDIKRFSRDGADIIRNATFLRSNFGVHVLDTKNQFDTRDRRKTLINYVHAGVSEQERLDIMERMIGGRIRRAMDGLPWTGHRPFGRDFRPTGKGTGEWYVTERGENMRKLLTRYANGEPLAGICQEYGFSSASVVLQAVHESQLSGPYHVTFNAPDIDVVDLKVPMPMMPQVITPALEKRVRNRMEHNRTWNKEQLRKYLLTGYIFCGHCGRSLTSAQADGYVYYRHHEKNKQDCPFSSAGASWVEPAALDYLYRFFLDEPSFQAAVNEALPSDESRKELAAEIKSTQARLAKINREVSNLIDAIAKGADAGLLIDRQLDLKASKSSLEEQLAELENQQAKLPDVSLVRRQAAYLRTLLVMEHQGKNWRRLPYDEIRRFLRYLFGDNTQKTGQGIFVRKDRGKWKLTFKGCVEFHHDVINGRPTAHPYQSGAVEILEDYRKTIKGLMVKPDLDYSSARWDGGMRAPR